MAWRDRTGQEHALPLEGNWSRHSAAAVVSYEPCQCDSGRRCWEGKEEVVRREAEEEMGEEVEEGLEVEVGQLVSVGVEEMQEQQGKGSTDGTG